MVGETIKDSFMDSYKEEGLCCSDILNLCRRVESDYIDIRFNKKFLRSIVHSHLVHIQELEKDVTGRKYNH